MVSDSKNCRLQVFSAAKEFVKVVASFTSKPFGLVRGLSNPFRLVDKLRRQDCGDRGQFVVVTCVPTKNAKKASIAKFRVLTA